MDFHRVCVCVRGCLGCECMCINAVCHHVYCFLWTVDIGSFFFFIYANKQNNFLCINRFYFCCCCYRSKKKILWVVREINFNYWWCEVCPLHIEHIHLARFRINSVECTIGASVCVCVLIERVILNKFGFLLA